MINTQALDPSSAIQNPEITADGATNAGWFASLFGYGKTDTSIPNMVSNGSDVPLPNGAVGSNKYSLDLGSNYFNYGRSDIPTNTQPVADQSWFTSIWSGAKSVTKFVFCPIFTTCPEPLPPGGITIGSLGTEAGAAAGNTLKNALGPILPILLMLAIVLVLVNVSLARLGAK